MRFVGSDEQTKLSKVDGTSRICRIEMTEGGSIGQGGIWIATFQ